MKLKFDANLESQLEAINSVTDLFEGLPPKQCGFEINLSTAKGQIHGNVGIKILLGGVYVTVPQTADRIPILLMVIYL